LLSSVVPLFRGWESGASGRWCTWSGPDRNGLKVPLAPKPRRSAGVHGGDTEQRFCYSFASLNACKVRSTKLANFDVVTKLMNGS